MPWREAFVRHLGPGAFAGITFGRWLKVLRDNRFSVDPPHWGRAAAITSSSLQNSFVALLEKLIYDGRVKRTTIAPPLFILGIWRSGTTHLHNLLTQDGRFAFPNTYQVCYPLTFLTTEKVHGRFVQWFMPRTRPQDNVAMAVHEPQEDEFAFASLTGRNPMLGWAFPRRAEFYNRYLTLRDLPESEVAQWKAVLRYFIQKVSYKHEGRPLVLKSPGHTCRIKLLLDVFPDARFVHIHRNPHDVFQSTQHLIRKVMPWWALQRPDYSNLEQRTLEQYKQVYDVFFEERGLIPQGRFHEISFEELEQDPLGQIRSVYESLSLPDFAVVEPALRRYVESLSDYKKNEFSKLPDELRNRIACHWRRCFDAWGYPT